jgi:hypothetical protein
VANDYEEVKKYFEKIKGDYLKNVGEWERN